MRGGTIGTAPQVHNLDGNRLYPEEQALLAAIRRWFRYRTPENLRHVVLAARDWIRAEHRREDGHNHQTERRALQ